MYFCIFAAGCADMSFEWSGGVARRSIYHFLYAFCPYNPPHPPPPLVCSYAPTCMERAIGGAAQGAVIGGIWGAFVVFGRFCRACWRVDAFCVSGFGYAALQRMQGGGGYMGSSSGILRSTGMHCLILAALQFSSLRLFFRLERAELGRNALHFPRLALRAGQNSRQGRRHKLLHRR